MTEKTKSKDQQHKNHNTKGHHHKEDKSDNVNNTDRSNEKEKKWKDRVGCPRTGKICNALQIHNLHVREFLAELLGTMILVSFGDAAVAQALLSNGDYGDFFTINWGWGVGVSLGVLVSGGVSGGHLNPAVTVAMATVGKIPWAKVAHFVLGQYIGAFLGAAIVFITYNEAFDAFDLAFGNKYNATGGVFATYPEEHLSTGGGFVDQGRII